ncbi:MAG: redoxin domain-containing protein [Planctomycetota bacterium]
MKNIAVLCLAGLLFAAAMSCDSKKPPESQTTPVNAAVTPPALAGELSPVDFVFNQKGKLVVALLGIEGCTKTGEATEVLAKMSQDCPADIKIGRLDVPIPDSQYKPLTDWKHGYYHAIDDDRAAAKRLEFFYYPTLYVIDRDGAVRYSGGCDEAQLKTMLAEMLQEPAGGQKKFYTPPLPAVGSKAPGFQALNLNGESVNLDAFPDKGATVLFFTSVDCPFSRQAAQGIVSLEKDFPDKGATIVTIEKSPNQDTVNKFYEEIKLQGPVIRDNDNSISKKYGVEPIPFYFVIDKQGNIAGHGPYTAEAVRQALSVLLGVKPAGTNDKAAPGAG